MAKKNSWKMERQTWKKERKEEKVCKINAIVFLAATYASIFLFLRIVTLTESPITLLTLAIPVALGIYNAIYLKKNQSMISRETLLGCSVLIKYGLIPMYIAGGLLICVLILLMFTPVVIMVFVTPVIVTMLSIYGYVIMLAGSTFSHGYLRKAKEENIYRKWIISVLKVLQFFFTLDVISVGVLALREKKYVKITIGIATVLILGMIGTFAFLVVSIIRVVC